MAVQAKIGYDVAMPILVRATARVRALMTAERRTTLRQFARFGTVGLAGFGVDVATVYLSMASLGLALAGLLAYLTAVTTTWALNRAWTFAGHGSDGLARQWLLFVMANSVGFVLNRGTFLLLVTLWPFFERHPVFAIFAGVAAGLFSNFNLSRTLVFRGARSAGSPKTVPD